MTVKQLMHTMDSYEFTQWVAFEQVYGPIGDEWQQEAIASIHEQLQRLTYVQSQAHFTDKHHRRGPVAPPQKYPRPYESLKFEPDEESDYSEEWMPPPEEEREVCPPNCVCKQTPSSEGDSHEEE